MFEITKGRIDGAQKVVIYGPEGVGKSTLAAAFPDPLFIDTEGGTNKMNVSRFPKPTSWEMLKSEVREAKTAGCKTLIIDTIDWAEQLCITAVCDAHQKKGIEDFGYGKGYVFEREEFGKFLDLLQEVVDSGVNVVLTAHAKINKFEQPDELGAYDRWELKLGQKTGSQISPLVKEWADMVLFCNYKTYAVAVDDKGKKLRAQGGERVMYTSHHPCWDAKNRDGLPPELPLAWDSISGLFVFKCAPNAVPKMAVPQIVTTPPPQQSTPAPEPALIAAPEPIGQANIPDGIPKALADLMRANNVDEKDIRFVVAQRGYFPEDTPIANYPPDFVNGVLIGAWDQVHKMVTELCGVPF